MSMQQPTLVYDGDCGFCTTSAKWIERRLDAGVRVEPWQTLDLEALGLTIDNVTSAAYFVDEDGSLHRGHFGIGRSLEHTTPPFRLVGRAMQHPPVAWLAAPVYRLVAKYRYRLPGATDACRID
jgi:predicted DCC family thiol-disulfide oxidoreductase YuxK